jgi:hypothetical protein
MMVRSSARVDLGIQHVGIVLFIRWRSGPSGTGRWLGRLDSAGALPGWGVKKLSQLSSIAKRSIFGEPSRCHLTRIDVLSYRANPQHRVNHVNRSTAHAGERRSNFVHGNPILYVHQE